MIILEGRDRSTGIMPPMVGRFYSALFDDPLLHEFWGGVYANCGYWSDDTPNGKCAGDRLVERALQGVNLADDSNILEVAAGQGGATQCLVDIYPRCNVTATGASAEQLDAAAKNVPGAEFVASDPIALQFDDATFDLVACFEAAFHFDTRASFLAESMRVLKPGGMLVLSDLLLIKGAAYMPRANHLNHPSAYRDVLTEAGFEQVVIEDITRQGWLSFRRRLTRFLARKSTSIIGWRDILAANTFWSYTIRYNVLARARKPREC